MIRMYDDKEYRVIHGSEIAAMKNPGFPWKRNSEENFKTFLEKSQEYFRIWKQEGKTTSYKLGDADLACVYLDCGYCVCVQQNIDGTYQFVTNGRHRLYVAKKYNLDILVCVYQYEQEYERMGRNRDSEAKKFSIRRLFSRIRGE